MTRGVAALTGATGFLGRHLARELADRGWRVRILTRRDPVDPLWRGFEPEVVVGDLADESALRALSRGAEVVIHAAGLVKARSPADFLRVNRDGAARVAEAAGESRLLLVSSLAAREPQLSPYAASKRAGEDAARAVAGARLTVVRPPAIYGPGDREILPLFKAAATSPVLPVFAEDARTALVHVEDAARQVATLAERAASGATYALSDSRPEGYGWREIMQAAAEVAGGRPRLVRAPAVAVQAAAALSVLQRLAGEAPIFTPGKAREFLHPDWGVAPHELAPDLPPSRFDLWRGLAHTAAWYRAVGWLPKIL
ncbi:NAD-dependent epimerase/dehydratase family protein [Phenylobacterium sp.]|uniref:NAD-dependent epimerase/dehydratase family protein n=1 Tax=Phenylobacterium sp. TaxID=1871053 RepID=UPI0035B0CAA2